MNILISGATGFLGSNVAGYLLEHGHKLTATYRTTSSFEKIQYYKNRINWINSDDEVFLNSITKINPDILIHAAWSGTKNEYRNNWEFQMQNFFYSKKLIEYSINAGVKKIIVFGSQAEYGNKNIKANEETIPEPNDAYGAVKLLLLHFLKTFCEKENIEWYWIRLFSIYGKNEDNSWLIPSVISHLRKNERIPLTKGEQKYNYLFIEDFLDMLMFIVEGKKDFSGVYNICNENPIKLKELLITIADILGVSRSLLNFGALPYREGQKMLIDGSCQKFREKFCYNLTETSINIGIEKTIGIINKI